MLRPIGLIFDFKDVKELDIKEKNIRAMLEEYTELFLVTKYPEMADVLAKYALEGRVLPVLPEEITRWVKLTSLDGLVDVCLYFDSVRADETHRYPMKWPDNRCLDCGALDPVEMSLAKSIECKELGEKCQACGGVSGCEIDPLAPFTPCIRKKESPDGALPLEMPEVWGDEEGDGFEPYRRGKDL